LGGIHVRLGTRLRVWEDVGVVEVPVDLGR